MGHIQLIGNVHFEEQPRAIQYREGTGWQMVRRWTGAKAVLNEFVLPNFASDVDVRLGPVQAEIQATYQLLDPTSFSWELIGNDHEVSIWEHPKFVSIMNALGEGVNGDDLRVSLMATLLKAKSTDPITLPSALDLGDPFLNPYLRKIQKFYTLLVLNQDTFYTSQYVLSKTILASSSADRDVTESEFKANHRNVFSIYDYSQLLTEEPTLAQGSSVVEATGTVWSSLFKGIPIPPGSTQTSGVNLVKFSDLGPGGQNLLWQKRTPKVQLLQRGMWQIVQEYWAAKNFDTWKYHRANTPEWTLVPDIQ